MSIEVISLEHFSAAPQADINSSTLSRPSNAVFHSFLSDYIKQDAATTTACRGRESVYKLISACGAALKCSNAIPPTTSFPCPGELIPRSIIKD